MFETDVLTAHHGMPPTAVLPSTTEQVSETIRFCGAHGVEVVPCGAGTPPLGGTIHQEDVVVLGVSKMNRVPETDLRNRVVRSRSGATNPAISQAILPDGFFYASDP